MLISGSDGTYYWATLNEPNGFNVKIIALSDSDSKLVDQFGQSWIDFLGAAYG